MDDYNKDLNNYLDNFLTVFPAHSLTPDDQKIIERNLANFMTQKLLRKKFRKQKLHADTIAEFQNKITNKIKENKPLHFTIPFGGYKHFWNTSHPEPDWAEIFTIRFLTEWVSPILATYKPGVIIEFISEDLILPRMNNYPDGVLEKYSETFSSLIKIYQKHLPENLQLHYFRIGDKCNGKDLINDVEKLLPERLKQWENLTEQEKEVELKRSRRSVMWQGKDNLENLSNEDKEKRMIESRLIELAYYDVEADPKFLGNYFTEDNRIGICFSFGLSPDNTTHWIALGSTYASVVDFWIGRGILEKTNDSFMPRIISKEQYEKIKPNLKNFPAEDKLPFENYQSVEIISSQDWTDLINM